MEEEVDLFYYYFLIVKFINKSGFGKRMRVLPAITSITSIVLSLSACTRDEKPFDCAYELMIPANCCDKYYAQYDYEAPQGFTYFACRDTPRSQEGITHVYELAIDDTSANAWERVYILDSAGWKIWAEGKPTIWSAGHK